MTAEVRLSCRAMATEWEIALFGERESFIRGVAEEALEEIRRIERQLSLFISTSDVADINRRAAIAPVVVEPRLYALLERCKALCEATDGAFDITVAPLMRCWSIQSGKGAVPQQSEIDNAVRNVGSAGIYLDPHTRSVAFASDGMMLDFGAIGKGYAVDAAIEIVRDYGVERGLLHGGTSTVYGLGTQPDGSGWKIAVTVPESPATQAAYQIELADRALSVSAPHGKFFEAEGVRYGHVIDPRSGRPTSSSILAAVCCSSAADSDALSTALLTLGCDWLPELARMQPQDSALAANRDAKSISIESFGSFELISN